MKIGYHASHEQFSPKHLLELVQKAEDAGFTAAMSSDHFHPWSAKQGQSGFAWSWLGAAMQATKLEFGVVNAPGQRYHPAIIAQAVATLDQMFPNRFWYAGGSGQALNENITGEKWPAKDVRNARLRESVEVMRDLWTQDYITNHGLIEVENAKLFTKPTQLPTVYGAALTEETAVWIAGWADGLITVSRPVEEMKKMIEAFKSGTNQKKPMVVKMQISYASSDEKALDGAWEQWKNNILPSKVTSDILTPEQFDIIGNKVRKEDMEKHVIIGSEPEVFINKINEFQNLGFEKIVVHNVNRDQENFLNFFKQEVLPEFEQH